MRYDETMSKNRKPLRLSDAGDHAAPILVPTDTRKPTFGDHLVHLAEHAGTIPARLDKFGRCVYCVVAASLSATPYGRKSTARFAVDFSKAA